MPSFIKVVVLFRKPAITATEIYLSEILENFLPLETKSILEDTQ